jgi:hypothetical protein
MPKHMSKSYNTFSEPLNKEFRTHVEGLIDQFLVDFYTNIPNAKERLDPEHFDTEFYKRSTVETIIRIGLKRAVDPLIANYWADKHPRLCNEWGLYGAEEGLHTEMFAKDLIRFGMTQEEIYSTKPTFATELLNGYFYYTMEVEDPLAAMVSGFYLETVASRTQPGWLDSIERHIGDKMTKGHLKLDEVDEHADMVWNMINRVIETEEDKERFLGHLYKINALFIAYFVELSMMMQGDVDQVKVASVATSLHQSQTKSEAIA